MNRSHRISSLTRKLVHERAKIGKLQRRMRFEQSRAAYFSYRFGKVVNDTAYTNAKSAWSSQMRKCRHIKAALTSA